ncbi:MAG: response regulator transcription factor [Rubricoccaceae bacterium]
MEQVLGIAHDVTERSETEARLNALHRQLAEARLALHQERTQVVPAEQARVLVVGGSSIHRTGLAALLSRTHGIHADAVASVRAALSLLETSEPVAVCVLDVQANLSRLRRLRDAWPDGAVVALVTRPAAATEALQIGAAGAVLRIDPSEEIELAVRSVLDGEPFLSESLIHAMAATLHTGPLPTQDALSERERAVLALYGAGLKRRQIAERLHLSPETISTYRKRLLHKLGLAGTADLVRYAVAHGLAADPSTGRP